MTSSGHVAFYPAFAQIEGRGAQASQISVGRDLSILEAFTCLSLTTYCILNSDNCDFFQRFHVLQRFVERSRRPPSSLHRSKLHRHPGKPWLRLPPRRSHPAGRCGQVGHRYLCRPGGGSTGSKSGARRTPS